MEKADISCCLQGLAEISCCNVVTALQLLVIAAACHPSALSEMLPLLLALHRAKRKLMKLADISCCLV